MRAAALRGALDQQRAALWRNSISAAPPLGNEAEKGTGADIFGQYADLGLRLDSRIETKLARDRNERCVATDFLSPIENCRGVFQPQFGFQFAVRTAGTVADRLHLDVDYDSQREFDASNNISAYYEGKQGEVLRRVEVGNVSFALPASRFITAGIPSGNYGIQAIGQLGAPATFGAFIPGVAKTYEASTTADVIYALPRHRGAAEGERRHRPRLHGGRAHGATGGPRD